MLRLKEQERKPHLFCFGACFVGGDVRFFGGRRARGKGRRGRGFKTGTAARRICDIARFMDKEDYLLKKSFLQYTVKGMMTMGRKAFFFSGFCFFLFCLHISQPGQAE